MTGDQLIDHIEAFYTLVDDAFAKLWERAPEKPSCFTCDFGHCCSQRVDVALFEALVIARRLIKSGRTLRKLRKQLRREGRDMQRMDNASWVRPCVFLKKGRCTIYAHRPLACRSHFVASDPELCSTRGGVQKVAYFDVGDFHKEYYSAIVKYHTALGLGHAPLRYIGSLPGVVGMILDATVQTYRNPKQFIERVEGYDWPERDPRLLRVVR